MGTRGLFWTDGLLILIFCFAVFIFCGENPVRKKQIQSFSFQTGNANPGEETSCLLFRAGNNWFKDHLGKQLHKFMPGTMSAVVRLGIALFLFIAQTLGLVILLLIGLFVLMRNEKRTNHYKI